jgi:hypothetical protein
MATPYGLGSMLKEGHKHFSGVEEAVMKNIEACKALSQMTRTSMGPNGARRPRSGRRALKTAAARHSLIATARRAASRPPGAPSGPPARPRALWPL